MPPLQCSEDGEWVQEGSVCFHPPPPLHPSLAFNCTSGKWTRTDSVTLRGHREKRFFWFFPWPFVCFIFCRRRGPPPNRPPKLVDCPSDRTETAPEGKSEIAVTWSKPTATDPDGGSPSVYKRYGKDPGSVFPEGRWYVTYEAKDGGGLVSPACSFVITVKVVKCPFAWAPRNGPRPTCQGAPAENQFGASCQFSCNNGYVIQGQRVLKCQGNKKWSHPFPTCDPVPCGKPGAVDGGSLTCAKGHSYPAWCSVDCKAGYRHTGPVYTSCTADGGWTPIHGCEDKEAPKFPQGCPPDREEFTAPKGGPVTLTWDDPVTTDNSGENVTLTSSKVSGSLFSPGFHSVKITATDSAGNSRSCKFFVYVKERRCQSLSVPDGTVSCDLGNREGSECTASCNQGYEMQGEPTLTCGANSTWSPAVPTCEEITCPESTPAVEGGEMQCSDGSYRYLSRCFLRCRPGYTVQPPDSVTCGADGHWSLPGSCRDGQPPSLDCPENVEEYASRLGEDTNVFWTPATVTDNSGESITPTSDVVPGSAFEVGVTHVTYTATDSSGNNGTCQFSVSVMTLSCDPPDLEDPARTRSLMLYECPDGHVHGAQCTLNCTYGYPLLGDNSITCERDDSQHPPLLSWQFSSSQPTCLEDNCPDLASPQNGAISCLLGNFGLECLMSCNENWDVPAHFNGRFICTNSDGFWRPDKMHDCTEAFLPGRANLPSEFYYFPDTCNVSMRQIRDNFITALKASAWKDACVNVPTCTVDNVQVTCGPLSRHRRSTWRAGPRDSELSHNHHEIRRRQADGPLALVLYFTITMDFVQNGTAEDTFKEYEDIQSQIVSQLKADSEKGAFDLEVPGGSLAPDPRYTRSSLTFGGCPEGTKYIQRTGSQKLSCVGCSKGNFLKAEECEACPVGQYTELDNATACTPCPPGLSTLNTGSASRGDCQEVCTPGHFSPNGFAPCLLCPAGQYQSRDQAVTCDPCPVGTWTVFAGAQSKDSCTAADVKLSPNVSLSASLTSKQSAVTVSAWLKLQTKSSLTFDFEISPLPSSPLTLLFFSDNATDTSPDPAVMGRWSFEAPSEQWTQMVIVSLTDDSGAVVSVYRDGVHLLNTSLPPLPTPFTAILTTTVRQGKALVSGLHGERRAWSREEVEAPSSSCTQRLDTNVLTWSPQPRAIVMPSVCDAVDDCQSSPCGGQGLCDNTLGGFRCHCLHGWTGSTCQDPPDACYQNQCQNGARCQPAGHNYSCVCQDQFSGHLCQLEKVHGGWEEWEEWSRCTHTCEGQQHRQRRCNNPMPANEGDNCTGLATESQSCGEVTCSVDGGWSAWSDWTPCSATCGGGETTRSRRCDNPIPQHGGAGCSGVIAETLPCGSDDCPVHGGWGSWSTWSACSVTCGDGTQSRARSCDTPFPANGGRACQGSGSQTRMCVMADCPECSELLEKEGTRFNCSQVDDPVYLKTCRVACIPGFITHSPVVYTCGEETGYLWDFERDTVKATDHAIQYCSPVKTPNKIQCAINVPLSKAPCERMDEVRNQVQENMKDLPCIARDLCRVQVQARCDNTGSVTTTADLSVEFGESLSLIGSSNSTVKEFIDIFITVDQSAAKLAINDTETLFSVSLDGVTITPDVNATSHTVDVSCPPGSVSETGVCVDCPAGFHEEGGRCVACPVDQYQDQTGATSCKPCPHLTTWDSPGASDISQCVYALKRELPKPEGTDIGLIVGSSLGAGVAVITIVIILVVCLRRKRKTKQCEIAHREYPDQATSACLEPLSLAHCSSDNYLDPLTTEADPMCHTDGAQITPSENSDGQDSQRPGGETQEANRCTTQNSQAPGDLTFSNPMYTVPDTALCEDSAASQQ